MSPYPKLMIAALVLAGCATIPSVPTQNILMFSADGKLVDPTGNLNCPEGASSAGPLCHEATPADGSFTHMSVRDYTELEDRYYEATYLESLLGCLREYFSESPQPAADRKCRQKPPLAPRPATSDTVNRLLIFVHGGLNTQIGSISRVVTREVRESGEAPRETLPLYNAIAAAGSYPLFINWRASFTSNYADNLTLIRQGEKQPLLGPATAPTVFVVDVMRGITRAPLVWSGQAVNDLKTSPGFTFLGSRDPDTVAKELICAYEYADPKTCRAEFRFRDPPFCIPFNVRSEKKLAGDRSFREAVPPHADTIPISVGEDLRRCPEMVRSLLSYVITVPSRLLVAPAVDSFGTSAWETMLRRTHLLFNRDDEFFHARSEPMERGRGRLVEIPRRGGISIFLRRLAKEIRAAKENNGREWQITLVGHSMGTIIVNQMLREVVQLPLDLPITNIVYMAAAASVRDVLDSVLPYLRNRPAAKFYTLMLHPIAEERESYQLADVPIDPGPRGSLLVMIDNFLSKPLTHLDRTAGRYENFLPAVHAIPGDLWPRVHIKTFSVGEDVRSENPQKHGEFTSRFKFWVEGCWLPEPAMKTRSKTPRDCVYDD